MSSKTMTAARGATLSVRNVKITFGEPVLDQVNLEARPGEMLAIVGASGTGKSTLLRVLCGLQEPDSGQVTATAPQSPERRARAAFVFQEPRLLPWLTVENNVKLVVKGSRDTCRQRVDEVLEVVGLAQHRGLYPKALSGGMAQRVALARALVTGPDLLLLDEPFSAVDALTRMRLQDHLLEVWEQEQFTAVLVTHDVDEAAYLADRVIVLGGQPARVSMDLPIAISRPRNRAESRLVECRGALLEALHLLDPAAPHDIGRHLGSVFGV